MAIIVKSSLDTSGIQEGTSKAQASLKGDISGALQSVQAKAQETEKSLKGMFDLQKIQAASASFGALKGILDKVSTTMLGLSKETVEANSKVADLAGKGAQALSVFGPWGTAIGFVGGALAGALSNGADQASARLAALEEVSMRAAATQRDLAKQIIAVREQLSGIDASTLSGAIQRFDLVGGQLKKAKEDLDDFKNAEDVLNAQLNANALAGKANSDAQIKERQRINDGVAKTEAQIKELTKVQEDNAATLRLTTIEQTEAITKKSKALSEMTYAELKAAKDTAKGRYDAAVGAAKQITELAKATTDDTDATRENAKAAKENNQVLSDAKAALDAASGALESYSKKTKNNADAIKEANKVIVDNINAVTAAMLERRAVANEAAADRAEDGTGLDTKGMRDTREEASQTTTELLKLSSTMLDLESSLPVPQLKAMDFALFNIKQKAKEVGEELKKGLVDVGVAGAEKFFDNIEKGNRALAGTAKVLEKAAAEQLKSIGKMLIAEGIHNELRAAAIGILTLGIDPQAAALAGLGAAEIAAGLAMGAGGALLGRRSNQGSGGVGSSTQTQDSLGSRESEVSGVQKLQTIKVYLGPEHGITLNADSSDRRAVTLLGKVIDEYQAMARKAPR